MPPVGGPHPGAHMNPAFFNPLHQGMPLSRGVDSYHGPGGPNHYNDYMNQMGGNDSSGPISDAEFEEIMSKNRNVSSTAITRAVADAAAGI